MLDSKISQALNKQIEDEFFSAYLYLAMSNHFGHMGFKGFANWMFLQYKEELTHAERLMKYINDKGGKVELAAIEKPKATWTNHLAMFEEALKHEQYITSSINKIVELSLQQKDYATNNILQWFVNEQIEEEAQVTDIINKMTMDKNYKDILFLLDQELGARKN